MEQATPSTLLEAMQFFHNPQNVFELVKNLRWPNGAACPHCGCSETSFISTRLLWKCKACKRQFSVKVGTIFEDSPIGLDKWLAAFWLLANAKNGISSYELHRSLGVTQKTAWFMLQRIRLALQNGSIDKLSGRIEADETYIGGKARNMHNWKRRERRGLGGSFGKTTVVGLLERGGKVHAQVIGNPTRRTISRIVKDRVKEDATLFTDSHSGYDDLTFYYQHHVIEHAVEYVRGNIHTNGIENFWSLLKRTISGTYVSVEPFHLFRYIDEQTFRFNHRKGTDQERFLNALTSITGKRLTYRELTGKVLSSHA